jgi:membrane protein
LLTTALFAMIYRFMPQATIEWRDVGIGALVTAALFAIGKTLIGLYIGKSALASGFGAAGSLAVLLAWVYYSAQIFLFGAEFTWAYAHAFGSHQGQDAEPAPGAAPAAAERAPVVRFR